MQQNVAQGWPPIQLRRPLGACPKRKTKGPRLLVLECESRRLVLGTCPGGYIVASHNEDFLHKVCTTRWSLEGGHLTILDKDGFNKSSLSALGTQWWCCILTRMSGFMWYGPCCGSGKCPHFLGERYECVQTVFARNASLGSKLPPTLRQTRRPDQIQASCRQSSEGGAAGKGGQSATYARSEARGCGLVRK